MRPPAHEIMDGIRAKTADIPGILVEVTAPRAGPPTGKPVSPALRARSRPAAGCRQKGCCHLVGAPRRARRRRWPAAARHRLAHRGEQERGREVSSPTSTSSAPACSLSPTAPRSRSIAHPTTTRRSTSWCASRRTGAVSSRSDDLHPDAGRPRADRELRHARAGAEYGNINRINGDRVITVSSNVTEGVTKRQGAAGADAEARQGRSRPERDLPPQGRGRGTCQGRGVPDEGVRHRTVPYLSRSCSRSSTVRLGAGWCFSAVVLSTIGVLIGLMVIGQPFGVVDDRYRHHRECRCDHEQQHRAD